MLLWASDGRVSTGMRPIMYKTFVQDRIDTGNPPVTRGSVELERPAGELRHDVCCESTVLPGLRMGSVSAALDDLDCEGTCVWILR